MDVGALGRRLHEVLILAILVSGRKHGYQIALDVEAETKEAFRFQHGTLYPILHRLEREGRIMGRWDRASGRRRKIYGITRAGRSHLEEEGGRILCGLGALKRLLRSVS
jgi:DNA-binding PadR family transcriptional regulator